MVSEKRATPSRAAFNSGVLESRVLLNTFSERLTLSRSQPAVVVVRSEKASYSC